MKILNFITALFLMQELFCQSDNIQEDMYLGAIELLNKYGYPAESHTVTTTDGYVLTLHRCPGSPKSPSLFGKPVIYLMHGILSDSDGSVFMGPHISLTYMLVDAGYDVWMGNARGNVYSRKHVYLDIESEKYWNFSWHEIGYYDLPNSIDYILSETGKRKLHYIGTSQGTTVFWVMGSKRPEYNEKILSMHALGPVAYLHNAQSPYINGARSIFNELELVAELLHLEDIAPTTDASLKGVYQTCRDGTLTQEFCADLLFSISGYDSKELNRTMLPVIFAHLNAGCSVKQLLHFGQVLKSKVFREYDYGIELNRNYYSNDFPPSYDLRQVVAPIFLYYGNNDWIADVRDVNLLRNRLPNVKLFYLIPYKLFNHMDFLVAINVRFHVYDKMLEQIREMDENIALLIQA